MEKKFDSFRNKYNYNDAGNAFLWGLLAPYIVGILTLFVAFFIASARGVDSSQITDNIAFIIISAILTPLSFASVFFVYNKIQKISFSACGLSFKKLNLKTLLLAIIIPIVCVFGFQYFITGTELGLEALGYTLHQTNIPLSNGWWFVLNLFLLALLPAIAEELIFRGIIFQGLTTRFSKWGSIALSALLFALMHGSLDQFIYPFILGMILAWIVSRTGNLLTSMIIHFLNNSLVLTLGFVNEITGFSFIIAPSWLFWVLAVGLVVVSLGILFLIEILCFKNKTNDTEEPKAPSNQKSIALLGGIIVASIIFIMNIVSSFVH